MIKLDFSDLTPQSVEFEYEGHKYVLREATGAVAKKFNNERASRIQYGPNGTIVGIHNLGDLEVLLVQYCLETESGDKLPTSIIEKWPHRMVKKLYETAETISGLKEPDPVQGEFYAALSRTDSPVDKKAFADWVEKTLPEKEFKNLKGFVEEAFKEDQLKE